MHRIVTDELTLTLTLTLTLSITITTRAIGLSYPQTYSYP